MSFSKLQFYGMLRFTFQKRYIHIHPNTCTHSGTDPKTYTHSGHLYILEESRSCHIAKDARHLENHCG